MHIGRRSVWLLSNKYILRNGCTCLTGNTKWGQKNIQQRSSSYFTFPLFTGTQQVFEAFHFHSHLPWWAAIGCATVFLRTVVALPAGIKQNRMSAELKILQNELKRDVESLQREMIEKGKRNRVPKDQLLKDASREVSTYTRSFYKQHKTSPLRLMMLPWAQLPLWITVSFALRNISGYASENGGTDAVQYLPAEGIASQGLLWFPDLSVSDPYYVIPAVFLAVNLLNIEINTYRGQTFWKYLTPLLRCLILLTSAISSQMPSALSLYWCVSSTCGLAQNIFLRMPAVRRSLDIPKSDSEEPRPLKHFALALNERLRNFVNFNRK